MCGSSQPAGYRNIDAPRSAARGDTEALQAGEAHSRHGPGRSVRLQAARRCNQASLQNPSHTYAAKFRVLRNPMRSYNANRLGIRGGHRQRHLAAPVPHQRLERLSDQLITHAGAARQPSKRTPGSRVPHPLAPGSPGRSRSAAPIPVRATQTTPAERNSRSPDIARCSSESGAPRRANGTDR